MKYKDNDNNILGPFPTRLLYISAVVLAIIIMIILVAIVLILYCNRKGIDPMDFLYKVVQ